MVNAKAKGTRFERECKKLIQAEEHETAVFRSPASLGSADLVTISKRSDGGSWVELIQCKYLRKYLRKDERQRLIDDAQRLGADPILMYRYKPRGRIQFENLISGVIKFSNQAMDNLIRPKLD